MMALALSACLAGAGPACLAQEEIPAASFLRLDDAGTAYLTLGGEVRERVESYGHSFLGLPGGRSFTAYATRLLADADLHLGSRFRVFTELGSFLETGRRPAERPTDRGDLELQQGFFDLVGADGPAGRLVLRLGRQELPLGSGRLVSTREATNVRLSFDAVEVTWTSGGRTLLAFAGRPVLPRREVFGSAPTGGESFWALDWTAPGALQPGALLPGVLPRGADVELFYLGRSLRGAAFARGAADETRHTFGGRIWARPGSWDASLQASVQAGTFGAADIAAWGAASDTGVAWRDLPGEPRFALRADVASGDGGDPRRRGRALGTFEAPYPALNYFSEAAIFAPANAFDVHPYLELRPARKVTAELGVDFIWRLRQSDAIYRAGGGILIPAGKGGNARLVTAMAQLDVTFRPSPFLAFQGALVHANAADLVRRAGGTATTMLLLQADLRF
jgi:Alginate export